MYFWDDISTPFWGNIASPSCNPSGLAANTTYYWQIVAKNISGAAPSPVWSFHTAATPLYSISILAGIGRGGFSGDGGPATQAAIWLPSDVTLDALGNIYLVDSANLRIRMIALDGSIRTVAGSGSPTFSGDSGPAAAAGFTPEGIAVDGVGNLYISSGEGRIRIVAADGTISTFAGNGTTGYGGDGGPATAAQFNLPTAITVDGSGSLYIVDRLNKCIRKVEDGIISTVAGVCGTRPSAGPTGVPATTANLDTPTGIAVDGSGNLYFSDAQGIKKVSKGILSFISPAGCCFGKIAVDTTGTLYAALSAPYASFGQVGKIVNGAFTPVGGAPTYNVSGPANSAVATDVELNPLGIATDTSGRVYVTNVGPGGYTENYVLVLTQLSGSPAASIASGGILNAASFSAEPLAPGSIATIYGSFTLNEPSQSVGAPLPKALAGLSVEIGGIAAPLFYVSANVVNVQRFPGNRMLLSAASQGRSEWKRRPGADDWADLVLARDLHGWDESRSSHRWFRKSGKRDEPSHGWGNDHHLLHGTGCCQQLPCHWRTSFFDDPFPHDHPPYRDHRRREFRSTLFGLGSWDGRRVSSKC